MYCYLSVLTAVLILQPTPTAKQHTSTAGNMFLMLNAKVAHMLHTHLEVITCRWVCLKPAQRINIALNKQ